MRDRTTTAGVVSIGSLPVVSIGFYSILLGVPLAFVWEAAGPYDDPKTWALPIVAMMTGLAWLARPREGRDQGAFRDVPSRLIRWAALVCLAWTAITTATSIAPLQSVLGAFGRGMGALMMGSAILLFFLVQEESRSAYSVRSLVDVALVGSMPVCLVALGQAAGWDPLPKPWDPAVSELNVRSTLGSHIFLGSYLVLLVPLVAARLEWALRDRAKPTCRTPARAAEWWRALAATVWVVGAIALITIASHWSLVAWALIPWGILGAVGWAFLADAGDDTADGPLTVTFLAAILAAQVLVVILTRARGAFIAMMVGLSVAAFAFLVRRRAWKTLTAAALCLVAAVSFLALLNLPGSPAASLRQVPILSRLGKISDVSRGSPGWVRLQVWKGIADGWKRQLRGEETLPDQSPRLRSVIGYGPETQLIVLTPLTSPFVRGLHAQIQTWRAQYVIDRAHNALLDHLVTEGLVGAALHVLLIGVVVAVGISRIRGSVTAGEATMRFGALGAVLAHVADGQVGIVTSMSLTLFWMAAAILTCPPWREPPGPSGAPRRRTSLTRWRIVVLIIAAGLVVVLGVASTRSLLASIDYAEGTRHALGGRMAAAHERYRTSVTLAPWLLAPAEAFASTALRLADGESDASRRLVILREADSALARARGHTIDGVTSWTLTAQLSFAAALAGDRARLPVSRNAFVEALRRQPDDAGLLAQWGWAVVESGDVAEARRIGERAVARNPRSWLGWAVLARSARVLGDLAAADAAAVKAKALAPPEARRLVDTMVP